MVRLMQLGPYTLFTATIIKENNLDGLHLLFDFCDWNTHHIIRGSGGIGLCQGPDVGLGSREGCLQLTSAHQAAVCNKGRGRSAKQRLLLSVLLILLQEGLVGARHYSNHDVIAEYFTVEGKSFAGLWRNRGLVSYKENHELQSHNIINNTVKPR